MIFVVLFFAFSAAKRSSRRRKSTNDFDFGYERDILDSPYKALIAADRDVGQEKKENKYFQQGYERGKILRLIGDLIQKEVKRMNQQRKEQVKPKDKR